MYKVLRLLAATALLAPGGYATLSPIVTYSGNIRISLDALGTNNPAGGTIRFQKPTAAATVRAAYLTAASTGFTGFQIPNGAITLNGTPVIWDSARTIPNGIASWNVWADVTAMLKPLLNAAPAGIGTIAAAEGSYTFDIDGEILAVIWDDATAPPTTITLLYGAQSTTGDSFTVTLAQPVDKTNPATVLDMSLGISYGYQSTTYDTGQWSILNLGINGQRISSSAGGQDDGQPENGALITVGGIGDSNANPADPFAHWIFGLGDRTDDELYSLLPFVNNGDTAFTVFTDNPSNDDNIFFAAITLGANTAIVGEGILLSPAAGAAPVGGSQSVQALVQDSEAHPIPGRLVTFTVVSGPNIGFTASATTNAAGVAAISYSSSLAGSDTIVGSMINSQSEDQGSNLVTRLWTGTNPVTETLVLGPGDATNALSTTHTVSAKVVNNLGQLMPNQPVTFSVLAGPNTGLTTHANTNAMGVATFSYSSSAAGTDSIRASTAFGGTLNSNVVTKNWMSIAAPTAFLSPGTATNPAGGKHSVTVRVFLANGVPAAGITLSVQVVSGPNAGTSLTGTTGADGSVTLSYIGNGGEGTDSLVASTPYGPSNPVTKTWRGLLCDVDNNGQVDARDIAAIQAARNTLVLPGDVRDADFDGLISTSDARACTLRCKKGGCAQ